MSTDERISAMKEYAERHGWKFSWSPGTQREPGAMIAIKVEGVLLRATSFDGLTVAAARMENALAALGDGHRDVYLQEPHRAMGRLNDTLSDLCP